MSRPIKEDQFNNDDLLTELSQEVIQTQTPSAEVMAEPKETAMPPAKPMKSDDEELKELEHELESLTLGSALPKAVSKPPLELT
jgi:hypothetical protein